MVILACIRVMTLFTWTSIRQQPNFFDRFDARPQKQDILGCGLNHNVRMLIILANTAFGLRSALKCLAESTGVTANRTNFRAWMPTTSIILAVILTPTAVADRDAAQQCTGIAAAEERLACFDAAYAVKQGSGSGSPATATGAPSAAVVTTAEHEGNRVITEEEFGLPQPPPPDGMLKSAIMRVERDSRDRLTFYLENGQVWKQIESTYTPFRVKQDPAVAMIKSSALGSFKLTVEGGSRSVRVKRIE